MGRCQCGFLVYITLMKTSAPADLEEFLKLVRTGCPGRVWICGRPHPGHRNGRCEWFVTNDPEIAYELRCSECSRMLVKCTCSPDYGGVCIKRDTAQCRFNRGRE
jgi:hypothetical protein